MSLRESVLAFQASSLRRRVAARYAAAPAKPKVDASEAESVSRASKSRFDSNKRTFEELKKLDAGDKKFDKGYKELYEAGEKAAAAAGKMIEKYEGEIDNLRGRAKQELRNMLEVIDRNLLDWRANKLDHHSMKDKRKQLPNTYGYAQKLESSLIALPEILKGNYDVQIDESWREH